MIEDDGIQFLLDVFTESFRILLIQFEAVLREGPRGDLSDELIRVK